MVEYYKIFFKEVVKHLSYPFKGHMAPIVIDHPQSCVGGHSTRPHTHICVLGKELSNKVLHERECVS